MGPLPKKKIGPAGLSKSWPHISRRAVEQLAKNADRNFIFAGGRPRRLPLKTLVGRRNANQNPALLCFSLLLRQNKIITPSHFDFLQWWFFLLIFLFRIKIQKKVQMTMGTHRGPPTTPHHHKMRPCSFYFQDIH